MRRELKRLLRSPRFPSWTPLYRPPFIWDGVYARFADVPTAGEGFNSEAWLAPTEQYTRSAWEMVKNPALAQRISPEHAALALVVTMLSQQQRPVRVVDFGGGMGVSYAHLRRSIGGGPLLEYWIVDNEESCRTGERLAAGDPAVRFTPDPPQDIDAVDVLVLNGVLQFIEDDRETLRALSRLRPAYWLLAQMPAGDNPRFVSAQRNIPGSTVPVWFFNATEVIADIERLSYRLICHSPLERQFDMDNFEPRFQVTRHRNLLFARCP